MYAGTEMAQPAGQMRQTAGEMGHAASEMMRVSAEMTQLAGQVVHAAGRMMHAEPAEPPHPVSPAQILDGMSHRESEMAPLSGQPLPIPATMAQVAGAMPPLSQQVAATVERMCRPGMAASPGALQWKRAGDQRASSAPRCAPTLLVSALPCGRG